MVYKVLSDMIIMMSTLAKFPPSQGLESVRYKPWAQVAFQC